MKRISKTKINEKNSRIRALAATVLAALTTFGLLTANGVNAAFFTSAVVVNQSNSRTYTTDADFAAGTLFNVNSNDPNSNQLQLNTQLSTFPVMWIANTGEHTVSKIDTDTGKELARYRTHFNSGSPSRTAVDRDGNVYVLNRTFTNRPMELFKILASGGIDRNGNGVIDTSSDLNNNGRTTLNATADPNEVLPLTDLNGNNIVDDNEIRDERIGWVSRVANSSTINYGRSLSLDPQGNLWLGDYYNSRYWKISSVDGSILGGPFSVAGNTPYGSAVDRNGILWGASLGNTLLRLDTNNTNPTAANGGVTVLNHSTFGGDYGIALANNKVYQSNYSNRNWTQYDPVTGQFSTPAYPNRSYYTYGIAVDSQGNIFGGRSNSGVVKWRPDGTVVCEAGVQPGAGGQHGVIVDSNNDVWLINLGSNTVSKYRGSDCGFLGVFPVGSSPYTYSDATGITAFTNTLASGKWSVVQDGENAGTKWGTVTWNAEQQGNIPNGASIVVAVRTADTQAGLGAANFVPISNDTKFNMVGRFIEVQATLNANASNESPVLSDITITEGNSAPVANDDGYSTDEDTALSVPAAGVLGNDTDGENDTLTASLVSGPTNAASFNLNGDGSFSYTPNPNFNGSDSFTYKVSDSELESNTATVSITIDPVNDNPTANNDEATVAEDSGANQIDVLSNDSILPDTGETLTVSTVTQGANGSVSITNGGADISYTPAADYFGADSFTYTISDGNGGSATATVDVTVTNVNDNPTANNDTATVAEDSGSNSIDVLTNDSILPDAGETLSVTGITQGANGSVSITNGGANVSYTPAANYFGADSFTYTVSDGSGGSATATVNVTVTAVNDSPTVSGAAISRQQGTAGTVSTIAAVSDVDNAAGSLTFSVTSLPTGITVTGITNNNGTINATVTAGCNAAVGANTVNLKVTDGDGAMGTGALTVNVTKETTPPVINPISNVAAQLPANSSATSMAVSFPLPTASDNCGAPVTVTTNPLSGSVFNVGTTTVNVMATDQAGNQSTGSFTVTVQYSFSTFSYSGLLLSQQALNQVTAGSNLPVRFTLSGYKGDNPYSQPPTSQQINCSTYAPIGPAQEISRFAPDPYYSSLYDFYQTTWRTQTSWRFTCRRLSLHMNDGTTKTLNFYFK